MTLKTYVKRRSFKQTPEPVGRKRVMKEPHALRFVVHRHKATRLHYDFRLELEGVLKSWAVPKGPSMNPDDKRLAMQVEDHPYEYGQFEGVIPEGNYGAGIVEIWDQGTYKPLVREEGNTDEEVLVRGLQKGDLKLDMRGRKLKGGFALVHMKGGREENAWLLIKKRDKYSVTSPYDSEQLTPKSSPINKALAKKKAAGRRR